MRTVKDRRNVQNDLNKLKIWCEINRMRFNEGNCKLLLLTGNNQLHGNKMNNSLLSISMENICGKYSKRKHKSALP